MHRLALTIALLGACATDQGPARPGDADSDSDVEWPPPIAAEYAVSTGDWTVPAGEERSMCFFDEVDADGGGLAIIRYEAEMQEHSHHFNMGYVPRGAGVDLPRGLAECQYGDYLPVYLAGSQWPQVAIDLPDGKAIWLPDGAIVVLEAHFVNATEAEVPARVDVRMTAVDPDLVVDYVGVYFNQMRSIEVGAGTTETLRARCPAEEATNVWFLTSHMHHFGERFEISLYDDALGTTDLIYESDDWSHPATVDRRDDPIAIGPEQGFEWSCRYANPGPEPLVGGNSAETEEMCVMAAFYWPDTGHFQYCYALPEAT